MIAVCLLQSLSGDLRYPTWSVFFVPTRPRPLFALLKQVIAATHPNKRVNLHFFTEFGTFYQEAWRVQGLYFATVFLI